MEVNTMIMFNRYISYEQYEYYVKCRGDFEISREKIIVPKSAKN